MTVSLDERALLAAQSSAESYAFFLSRNPRKNFSETTSGLGSTGSHLDTCTACTCSRAFKACRAQPSWICPEPQPRNV